MQTALGPDRPGAGAPRSWPPPPPPPCSSAYDARLRQKVAVKKLSRPFQSLVHARRTYRELRLLRHLKHENVSWGSRGGAGRAGWAGPDPTLAPPARSSGCWTSSLRPRPSRTSAKCKRRRARARRGGGGRARCRHLVTTRRYLVTTLMGADLNNIVKCQALSDEHVQFLVYQLLRGLKVGGAGGG